MNAITLHQPWASLIAFGLKTIETRTHNRFRKLGGQTIAIHAARCKAVATIRDIAETCGVTLSGLTYMRLGGHLMQSAGCVVAVVDVLEHRVLTEADSAAALCPAEGLFGLILANVRQFREPIPATGRQWAWDWEPPEGWEELLESDVN